MTKKLDGRETVAGANRDSLISRYEIIGIIAVLLTVALLFAGYLPPSISRYFSAAVISRPE